MLLLMYCDLELLFHFELFFTKLLSVAHVFTFMCLQEGFELSTSLTDLKPHTSYLVQVAATNYYMESRQRRAVYSGYKIYNTSNGGEISSFLLGRWDFGANTRYTNCPALLTMVNLKYF